MTNYRNYVKSLPLMEALWWFIENINDNEPVNRNQIFFDLRERYREQQTSPISDLIKATKSLVDDIESMQDGLNTTWFGDFSESQAQDDIGTMAIEWPNLAIQVEEVKKALGKLPGEQGILGKTTTMMIVDEIGKLNTTCSVCGEPQFNTPSGDTCKNGHGGAPPSEDIRINGSERDLDWNEPIRHGGRSGYDF